MKQKGIAYILPPSTGLPDFMDLGDNTIVRKITHEDREQKRTNNILSMRSFDFDHLNYVMETEGEYEEDVLWEIGESDKHPYREIEKNFDTVILALRLFKTGVIGYNEFDLVDEKDEFGNTIHGTISRITYFRGDKPFKLQSSETEDFIQFYHRIKGLSEINFTKIALERFRKLYERDHLEDRLIDIFVAFESLFLKDNAELTYRLSISIAAYLEDSLSKRKEAFKNVKEAYSIRSKIVHGITVDEIELKRLYDLLEEYLRKCLIKILEGKQGLDKKDLLDYVEDRILE